MHASTILKNTLLVGSCPVSEDEIEQLKAAGITAVLNLQTDEDLFQREIDWPAMEAVYRRQGVRGPYNFKGRYFAVRG